MRDSRWCCEIIKEAGGQGRVVVTGNRRAESKMRNEQCMVEQGWGYNKSKTFIRPIIEFSNFELWQYIRENNVSYCNLYDIGALRNSYGEGLFTRLGCVLCPNGKNIELEIAYFPKIADNWKRACDRIVADRQSRGNLTKRGKPYKYNFLIGQELFDWYIKRGKNT